MWEVLGEVRNGTMVSTMDALDESLQTVNIFLLFVSPIILLSIGLPGNALTIIVLRHYSLYRMQPSFFLISLCVFNMLSLLFSISPLFTRDFHHNIHELQFESPMMCIMYSWACYTCLSIVNWHLVVFSASRLHLFLKKKCESFKRPMRSVFYITVMCGLVQLCVVFMGEEVITMVKPGTDEYHVCILPQYSHWTYLNFAHLSLVPALLLASFNARLMYLMYKKRARQDFGEGVALHTWLKSKHVVLLTASSVHLAVTTLPLCLLYLNMEGLFPASSRTATEKRRLLLRASQAVLMLNNATNYFIYCFFGNKFRTVMKQIISPYVSSCSCRSACRLCKPLSTDSSLTSLEALNFSTPRGLECRPMSYEIPLRNPQNMIPSPEEVPLPYPVRLQASEVKKFKSASIIVDHSVLALTTAV